MVIPSSQHALRLAKRRQGATARDFAEAGIHRQVLTRYALERYLYRLSRSTHAEKFVLKVRS
jgi:hypothetical protein